MKKNQPGSFGHAGPGVLFRQVQLPSAGSATAGAVGLFAAIFPAGLRQAQPPGRVRFPLPSLMRELHASAVIFF